LITKPKDRLTAEQAMTHPWISSFATSGEKATSAETLTRSLKNIYVFKNLERLKKAVLTYIATQLNEKETISLKQVFQQFDKNGDGLITIEELYNALSKFKTKEEIKEIMDSCDINSKGNIDYTEFIAATMDESIYLQKDKLLAAFNLFDKDKSGKISTSELKEILGKDTDFSEQVWSDMIKQVDKNGDGEIDYDEFMGMMYDIRKQLSKLK
jgi:calcium-dependent protein kinase